MKWTTVTINLAKWRKAFRGVFVMSRMFVMLTLCSMLLFILLGFGTMLHKRLAASPVSSMQGFAAAVSSQVFKDMLGMEMPQMAKEGDPSILTQSHVVSFLFQMLTNINPNDPKSLIAREIPGLGDSDAVLIRKGMATDLADSPEDYHPDAGLPKGEDGAGDGVTPGPEPHTTPETGAIGEKPGLDKPDTLPADKGQEKDPADNGGTGKGTNSSNGPAAKPTPLSTKGKKVVFVYHSHNRESFLPELPPGRKYTEDPKKNITLVGARLTKKLEELGVGAVHSNKDYSSTMKNYNWYFSYKYSLNTVKEAFATNPEIKFLFDIHRDSQRRKKTTATIKGKAYAQVYFIIGHRNPNWKKNEEFATKIHDSLEKKYPGISRGIWGKTSATGNGEYNQSVSPDSVLIEIGGVDNTLEECYRTADILAKEIAAIYWEAERVNATAKK